MKAKMVLVMAVAGVGSLAWGTTFNVPADGTLQAVIDRTDCLSGDEIEISPGTYSGTGYLNVDLRDKDLVIRSIDPDDPDVVAATVIDCGGSGRAFVVQNGQTAAAQIAGLTIINGYGSWGGAIYVTGAEVTISRCVIADCSGTLGGAIGISNANGTPMIERCQLIGNDAVAGGGAVYITGSSAVLKNCIISNNTAPRAGGIYSQNAGNSVVSQCTITNNSGGSGGGAIWCYGGHNMTLNGNILWGNTATSAAEILVGGAGAPVVVDMSYCNVQGLNTDIQVYGASTLAGVGNIEADPLFEADSWRLTEESLCIDAGDPEYAAEEGETDVYGSVRVWGDRVDIGAAEYFVEEVDALKAQVRFWPHWVNLRQKCDVLLCTIQIAGHESDEIDVDSIMLGYELAPMWVKQFKCVKELVARFDIDELAELSLASPGETVTLTVIGTLLDGTPFEGSGTVKVYEKQWYWSKHFGRCGKSYAQWCKDKLEKRQAKLEQWYKKKQKKLQAKCDKVKKNNNKGKSDNKKICQNKRGW
ncbi:MAG: right-handed parallel beta-helix repeat-containing protein [Anaerohalosphaeraceae bacterium]|jgi:hypothetical protein